MYYVISAPDFVISGADFVISAPDFVISGIALDSMSDFFFYFAVPFERGAGLSGICPLPDGKRIGFGKLYLRRKGVCIDSNGQPLFFQLNFTIMKTKKKIMFDDYYGLTKAVIELRKIMTRRVCKDFSTGEIICAKDVESIRMYPKENLVEFLMKDGSIKVSMPKYKVGEVVAVAQSYKSIHDEMMNGDYGNSRYDTFRCAMVAGSKGWGNKMFVKADLMPHQIQITDVKIERLQDISDDDVLREGFSKVFLNNGWGNAAFHDETVLVYYDKLGLTKTIRSIYPKEAFAALIDKIYGSDKGIWESNPYNYTYSFKLIK